MERAHKVEPIIVHKEGDEGTLTIDALSGAIVTELDQRPDWADGLVAALHQQRLSWYELRLGAESAAFKAIKDADAIEYADLDWLGISEDTQDEITIEANPEYRSEVVAKALGIDTMEGELGAGITAEIEVDTKRHTMSQHERNVMEQAVAEGFTEQQATEQQQAAGGTK